MGDDAPAPRPPPPSHPAAPHLARGARAAPRWGGLTGSSCVPDAAPWDRLQQLRSVVDAMGSRSAKAQGLAAPITSLQKLCAGGAQRLYVSARQTAPQRMEVLGILKAGPKNLFIRDEAGRFHEICPPCVLDFYVHEAYQRRGVGRALFQAFLADQGTSAAGAGYDRPSPKFLAFLRKHFHLANYVPQANNFVVFKEYFEARGGDPASRGGPAAAAGRGGGGGGVWSSVSQRPLTPTNRELFARRRSPTPPQAALGAAGAYLSAAGAGPGGSGIPGWPGSQHPPLHREAQQALPRRSPPPSSTPWGGGSEGPGAARSAAPWAVDAHVPLYGRRAGRRTPHQHAHANFQLGHGPAGGGETGAAGGGRRSGGGDGRAALGDATRKPPPVPADHVEQSRVAKHGRRAPGARGPALGLRGDGAGRLRMASKYAMQGGQGAASCLVW